MHVRILRWLATPLAAVLAMMGTALLLSMIGDVITASMPTSIVDSVIPADIRMGIFGATVAAVTIVAAWGMAPSYRSIASLAILVGGGWLAWQVLWHWNFPEHHPKAYQESKVPLVLTLLGGLATQTAVSWYEYRRRTRARSPRV